MRTKRTSVKWPAQKGHDNFKERRENIEVLFFVANRKVMQQWVAVNKSHNFSIRYTSSMGQALSDNFSIVQLVIYNNNNNNDDGDDNDDDNNNNNFDLVKPNDPHQTSQKHLLFCFSLFSVCNVLKYFVIAVVVLYSITSPMMLWN